MTIKEIEKRIEQIVKECRDDEMAHSMEDDLYEDVLLAIANGEVESPAEAAAAVLQTLPLHFARWCA